MLRLNPILFVFQSYYGFFFLVKFAKSVSGYFIYRMSSLINRQQYVVVVSFVDNSGSF